MKQRKEDIKIDGYEVLDRAGEGGMATVWTAKQTSLDRVVAIKVLSPELLTDPESVERFHMEARAAAKIKHPGIVQVYDAGETGGMVYTIMEYVAGCTVGELLLRKSQLPEDLALAIAEGVGMALLHAWNEARIIHCDIKPDNIMVERNGTIKVADLGLAQVVGVMARGSGMREIMGTPNYLSPEQASGDRELDFRTDIYALGATLYHITTGKLPFGDIAPRKILDKQKYGYLDDPLDINPELTPGFSWLIEKMMIKDRTLRYDHWDEVLTDIKVVHKGGYPAGTLPSTGRSTILRGGKRTKGPSEDEKKNTQRLAKVVVKGGEKTEAKQQRIVIPKSFVEKVDERKKKKRKSKGPNLFFWLILLALLAAAGYGVLTFFLTPIEEEEIIIVETEYAPPATEEAQPVEQPKPAAAAPEPAPTPAPAPQTPAAQPAARSTADASTVKWKDPDFLRGAKAYNMALEIFQAYMKDREHPETLKKCEKLTRYAIERFERCQDKAPPEVDMKQFINQCYHLLSDCRQMMIMVPSDELGTSKKSGQAAPRLARPSRPTRREPGEQPLTLAPSWNMSSIRDKYSASEDLHALLSQYGAPAVDTSPDPGLHLASGITYLMPMRDAARKLGARPSNRRTLNCPGFPPRSLYFYSLKGEFPDGFDEATLITDAMDRVVAVQFSSNSQRDDLWFDPALYSERWSVYDFASCKGKGNSKWRVGHQVHRDGQTLQINTELVDYDQNGYFQLGKSRGRISLYLPQPLVNIILYRIEKPRTNPPQ